MTKFLVPGCTSQSNEDHIIAEIFQEIGETNRRFFEFGCGDGRQNNSIALLKRGWSGTWCEPHKRRYLSAKERWADYPVLIRRRLITPEKVNVAIAEPLDFLSIDIDGNDYAVWKALKAKPRVVCIEVHPPSLRASMDELARSKGCEFYCMSASGVNAFYVEKKSLTAPRLGG